MAAMLRSTKLRAMPCMALRSTAAPLDSSSAWSSSGCCLAKSSSASLQSSPANLGSCPSSSRSGSLEMTARRRFSLTKPRARSTSCPVDAPPEPSPLAAAAFSAISGWAVASQNAFAFFFTMARSPRLSTLTSRAGRSTTPSAMRQALGLGCPSRAGMLDSKASTSSARTSSKVPRSTGSATRGKPASRSSRRASSKSRYPSPSRETSKA
mmetsp:Transcript_72209/g.202669  ORF Transcript_72209/g.202669 Transcript_72209/m.202669 type:complete len:210 (-) Transcript_72209:593-1222(-)